VKIFPQKFFALKVGLGQEELQGILLIPENLRTSTRENENHPRIGGGG